MRRKLIIGGFIVVIILAVWFFLIKPRSAVVEQSTVQRGTVTEELVLSGEIQAKEHAALPFASGGELSYVGVRAGDSVLKGQILARLNVTGIWAGVQQADANLRNAQASLDRVYDQVKGHEDDETFAQREARTAAETAKDAAYFALIQAKHNYNNAIITAPFGGVVTYVANTAPGITVSPAQTQIEIINPNTIYFTVYAEQTDIPTIKEGQSVEITIDAFPEETITGTVMRIPISPSALEIGVIYPVEVSINATSVNGNIFRIGMTGDAYFVVNSVENVLYVPPQYLKRDSQGQYLSVESGKKVYVEVGIEGEDRVEIKGDIEEGLVIYD